MHKGQRRRAKREAKYSQPEERFHIGFDYAQGESETRVVVVRSDPDGPRVVWSGTVEIGPDGLIDLPEEAFPDAGGSEP